MKTVILKMFPHVAKIKNDVVMKKWGNDIYKQHKRFNVNSNTTQTKAGYLIMLDGHALEKGMTSSKPRCFGVAKTQEIIKMLNLYEKMGWSKDFAYDFGISILSSYCHFYESHNWSDNSEYKEVKAFIKDKTVRHNTGTMTIRKADFMSGASIDYDKFLSSRHSVRDYLNKKISSSDIKKAVKMAIKTPTACNRQMLKVYYVFNDDIKNKIIKYSKGMTGFNNDAANMIVVTYDVSSFRYHEMNQGLFNAGLFSMNLVNALHSIGIGSCMLEYWVKTKDEEEEKRILGIPKNEKIAIVIAAGYYKDETVVPCSMRKNLEEVYREVI